SEKAIMGGAAYIASRIAEPGVIVQTGQMARLRFGPVFELQRKAAELFLGACREAKIDAELVDDIVRVLWEKFVLLVALSATTTVTRKPIGVVRSDPDMRWLLEATMRETWEVGRKRGVALPDDFVARTLAFVDGLPPEMKASMLGDLETGRTQLPRPFPFMRTIDPRQYSTQLMQSTRLPAITYKALGNLDEAGWRTWLSQSQGIEFISVVGRPVSGVRYALPLSRAIRIAASDAGGFTIGGVVIAERHTALRSEAARLLAKGIE